MERLDLNGRRSGKMKTHCPLCRDRRKDKRDRSVSVDKDKGIAFCHYCGASFQKNKKKEDAALPCPAAAALASVDRFLFDRKISRKTQTKMRVRTAEEWMPQTGRKTWCVCLITMYKQPGALREPVPELYDINGSAAFCNKCDFGLTVERDYTAGATRIHIQKVKFRHLGQRGEALFMYNTTNGCYVPCEIDEQTGKAWKATFDNTPFFNTTTL
ncbi:MAG: hypothetical protein LBU44_06090 [Mediterranea sp.]|jgi:hypothetical protein|nr:hypothetical protein [Mediterranea sp.]